MGEPDVSLVVLLAGVGLCVAGIVLGLSGLAALHRSGTEIDPRKPATVIVSEGPYAHSRHPMYVAFTLAFCGIALVVGSVWAVVVAIPLAITVHFGVVLREERYLERKFPAAYERYRARVRRYL